IIGLMQHDMAVADAAQTYSVLTIGDGLVSQVPALIVSVAAGLLVSKAGVEGAADKALTRQFTGYPQALAMVSVLAIAAGRLPGMPLIPFGILGVLAGVSAFVLHRQSKQKAEKAAQDAAAAPAEPAEPPIGESL